MKLVVSTVFLGLFLSSAAFATICTDTPLADCGNFDLIGSTCSSYDRKTDKISHTEGLTIAYKDALAGLSINMDSISNTKGVEIFRGQLHSYSKVLVQVLTENGKVVYTTSKIEYGRISPRLTCLPIP